MEQVVQVAQMNRQIFFETLNGQINRLKRLVEEGLEVVLIICNNELHVFDVPEMYDLLDQIIPTAFVLDTGFWPLFKNYDGGKCICVCSRFAIVCRHRSNSNHCLDLDHYPIPGSNQEFKVKKHGQFKSSEYTIHVAAFNEQQRGGFFIDIELVLQGNKASKAAKPKPQFKRSIHIAAKYEVKGQFYPACQNITLSPNPINLPTFGKFMTKLIANPMDAADMQSLFRYGPTLSPFTLQRLSSNVRTHVPRNHIFASTFKNKKITKKAVHNKNIQTDPIDFGHFDNPREQNGKNTNEKNTNEKNTNEKNTKEKNTNEKNTNEKNMNENNTWKFTVEDLALLNDNSFPVVRSTLSLLEDNHVAPGTSSVGQAVNMDIDQNNNHTIDVNEESLISPNSNSSTLDFAMPSTSSNNASYPFAPTWDLEKSLNQFFSKQGFKKIEGTEKVNNFNDLNNILPIDLTLPAATVHSPMPDPTVDYAEIVKQIDDSIIDQLMSYSSNNNSTLASRFEAYCQGNSNQNNFNQNNDSQNNVNQYALFQENQNSTSQWNSPQHTFTDQLRSSAFHQNNYLSGSVQSKCAFNAMYPYTYGSFNQPPTSYPSYTSQRGNGKSRLVAVPYGATSPSSKTKQTSQADNQVSSSTGPPNNNNEKSPSRFPSKKGKKTWKTTMTFNAPSVVENIDLTEGIPDTTESNEPNHRSPRPSTSRTGAMTFSQVARIPMRQSYSTPSNVSYQQQQQNAQNADSTEQRPTHDREGNYHHRYSNRNAMNENHDRRGSNDNGNNGNNEANKKN